MKKLSKKQKQTFADLGLLLVAMIWGGGFVFSKQAVAEMRPMSLMAARFTIAFLFSLVFFFNTVRKMRKEELKAGIIIGIFLFIAYSLQMTGLQYIGAGRQAFETGIYVVLVPFGYWFVTRKEPDRFNFIAAFVMLVGMGLLTLNPGEGLNFNQGDALTVSCAFFFAAQIIANGIYASRYNPVVLTVVQLGTAALCSLIMCFFTGSGFEGISTKGWLSAVYLGFLSTFICALLQTICQKYTTETRAAILMCLETVFGSIFSLIFLHESFSPLMTAGCILIFLAIIISETKLSFLRPHPVEAQDEEDTNLEESS